MTHVAQKTVKRERRHARVRAKVSGSAVRPRLSVYKSNTRIVAQLINDSERTTVAAVSSSHVSGKTPLERAKAAAQELVKQAKEKGIQRAVFDRGGFAYTGTIKAFADSARDAGLDF